MDGVLVDFLNGVYKLHGKVVEPQGYFLCGKDFGISENEFWKGMDYDFWSTLEPMADAFDIVDVLEHHFGIQNICILSSPSHNAGSMPGKVAWLETHLPSYSRRFLFGPQKEFCAGPNSLLVDDYDKNTETFAASGGRIFLVPRQWNSLKEQKDLDIPSILDEALCRLTKGESYFAEDKAISWNQESQA